jgi:hypothetical protein
MAIFIHIADARDAASIRRSGLKARAANIPLAGGAIRLRVVYCVPVVPDFQATFQWQRELKRWGYRSSVAVQFRIEDLQEVYIGKFARPHVRVSAAEACGMYMKHADPFGLEVMVPRTIKAAEIVRMRELPKTVGWRYSPTVRDTFFSTRGEHRAKSRRRKFLAAKRRRRRADAR